MSIEEIKDNENFIKFSENKKEYMKQYLKEYHSKIWYCSLCNKNYTIGTKYTHLKSVGHLKKLENNNKPIEEKIVNEKILEIINERKEQIINDYFEKSINQQLEKIKKNMLSQLKKTPIETYYKK
jgi:hypothetical protein